MMLNIEQPIHSAQPLRKATPLLSLSSLHAPDASGFLFELDAFDLWTFTHPNAERVGRAGVFRIYDSPASHPAESVIALLQSSEDKHCHHPGRYEWVPPEGLYRDYDIGRLRPEVPVAASGHCVRQRFLVIFSERSTLPVGASRVSSELRVAAAPDGRPQLRLSHTFHFTLIRPEYRGLAFGAALARARGRLCGADVEHVARTFAHLNLQIAVQVKTGDQHLLGARLTQASLDEMEAHVERARALLGQGAPGVVGPLVGA